jgi:hypothetical protein
VLKLIRNAKKKYIEDHPYIAYSKPILTDEDMLEKSKSFYDLMENRRSVRGFLTGLFREVIENLIKTSQRPLQGHKQPWTFCVVSNPEVKKQIRIAAEEARKL